MNLAMKLVHEATHYIVVSALMARRLLRLMVTLCDRSLIKGPRDIWSPRTRFIEIDCEDKLIAEYFMGEGFTGYLGLIAKQKNNDSNLTDNNLENNNPDFFDRYLSRDQIGKNNAEVIILSGKTKRNVWDFSAYRHARFIAWSLKLTYDDLIAAVGWMKNVVTGNIKLHCVIRNSLKDRKVYLVVNEVLRTTHSRARRYLSSRMGVQRYLRDLSLRSVRYVVLRWFENMPAMEPGEDIDFLVHDDDMDAMDEILGQYPGLIPCDVYSVSGLPGSQYRDMAYYPPYLASRILEDAVMHNGCCYAPSPEQHFFSLAFHAAYHKGLRSGIKSSLMDCDTEETPEHDYLPTLHRLARDNGFVCGSTLEEIDDFLASHGWRPPRDMLAKLSEDNTWIRKRFFEIEDKGSIYEKLVVFVFREKVLEHGLDDLLMNKIEESGFRIIASKKLSQEEIDHSSGRIRGGNWGRGPFPQSGGGPAQAVVAIDTSPVRPPKDILKVNPHLSNENVRIVKEQLRTLVNKRIGKAAMFNAVHSSDNGDHALDYIGVMFTAEEKRSIMDEVRKYDDHDRFSCFQDQTGRKTFEQ